MDLELQTISQSGLIPSFSSHAFWLAGTTILCSDIIRVSDLMESSLIAIFLPFHIQSAVHGNAIVAGPSILWVPLVLMVLAGMREVLYFSLHCFVGYCSVVYPQTFELQLRMSVFDSNRLRCVFLIRFYKCDVVLFVGKVVVRHDVVADVVGDVR